MIPALCWPHAAPDRPRPVYQQHCWRRLQSCLHDRQSVDCLADRQSARGRCAIDACRAAGGGACAGLSSPCLQGEDLLGRSLDRSEHAPRLSVRADVENPEGALKPGMFANFSIIAGDSETAPVVPQSAIVCEGDTARVWVAGDDGTIAARSVRTGPSVDGMVEILAGLSQREKVVTSGALFIDRAANHD